MHLQGTVENFMSFTPFCVENAPQGTVATLHSNEVCVFNEKKCKWDKSSSV